VRSKRSQVWCKPALMVELIAMSVTMTQKQREWFQAFKDHTGGDAVGFDDFRDGVISFEEAAKLSISCYRMEAEDTASRLENLLDPPIL